MRMNYLHDIVFYSFQVDVMKVIYRYLQNTVIGNEEARKKLRNLPLVIVDLGYTLVKPRQVAINLFDDDQIIPYLYKVSSITPSFMYKLNSIIILYLCKVKFSRSSPHLCYVHCNLTQYDWYTFFFWQRYK